MKDMDILDLKWVILISLWAYGHSQMICPKVAELASTVQLTCIFGDPEAVLFRKNEWVPGESLTVTCIAFKCFKSPDDERINATVVNTTHSFLEVQKTQTTDRGVWQCEARGNGVTNVSQCSLVLRKIPSCDITSDKNTRDLLLNEDLTLTVNITNYYCSVPGDFLLKTGYTTEDLKTNHSVVDVDSGVFKSTFNISNSHIGYLELLFNCNNVSKTVPCGGVKSLLKKPPSCTITSDKSTKELDVGEELSLSVYIEEYSCSHNTEYQLQIGEKTFALNKTRTGVFNATVTFHIRESHFGPVRLNITCNYVTREVLPVGITELQRRSTTTTTTTTASTTTNCKCTCPGGLATGTSPSIIEKYLIVIIAAPIGGIALIIAVILLYCYCLKPRCKSSKISRGYNDSCPYADVADNINSRPVTIRPDAYAEISDINGTFTNQAFDKESARHQDDNHIILSGRSGDYVQKEAPQAYSTSALRPDDLYSKVNKRTSTTSVSGQC